MKRLTILFLLMIPLQGISQNLDAGFRLYENGDYVRALKVFEQSELPQAYLFAGKSYFNMGNSYKAILNYQKISKSAPFDIFQDALFSEAVAHYDLGNYSSALRKLYRLSTLQPRSPVVLEGQKLYRDLLDYLSLNQKLETFNETNIQEIRFDILDSVVGKVKYPVANSLFDLYKRSSSDTLDFNLQRIERILSDSISYSYSLSPKKYPEAPGGTVYRIGVALPSFEPDQQAFHVSQGLYFGIQYAVERFNSENNEAKVFLYYNDTNADINKAENAAANLIWNKQVDAIIGPMISETARKFAEYAEMYEVPMIAPLANSDTVNIANNYAFQLNPTFGIRGKQMARFAVQNLGLDTLAILAESTGLGAASAVEFRHEAERLGAHVAYNFVQNLEEQGYAIGDYTQIFTKDSVLIDSLRITPVEAVYAPFTGDAASTLIESLLTDLEAMRSSVTILGSEEWEFAEIENRRMDSLRVYYTKSFHSAADSSALEQFNRNYLNRFNIPPTQFSYIGYDTATLLLEVLKKVGNPVYLKEGLRNVRRLDGLSTSIIFDNSNINQFISIKKLKTEEEEIEN